jgi:Fe-S-cluster-containing hydrogenase component 2
MRDARPLVDPELCTGCRTCEVICTFHHTGGMGTGASSLQISKSNHTAETGWQLDSTCDGCAGEDEALCAKYCQLGAIRLNGAAPPNGTEPLPGGSTAHSGGRAARQEMET